MRDKRSLRARQLRARFGPMSPDTIKAIWDENGRVQSEAGTRMHEAIEDFYNDIAAQPASEEPLLAMLAARSPELAMFKAFHESYMRGTYEPWRAEWLVFDEELDLAGAIDFLVFNPASGKHKILDWKRAKEIRQR